MTSETRKEGHCKWTRLMFSRDRYAPVAGQIRPQHGTEPLSGHAGSSPHLHLRGGWFLTMIRAYFPLCTSLSSTVPFSVAYFMVLSSRMEISLTTDFDIIVRNRLPHYERGRLHFSASHGAFQKKLGAFLIFAVHFSIKPGATPGIVVHFEKSWCKTGGRGATVSPCARNGMIVINRSPFRGKLIQVHDEPRLNPKAAWIHYRWVQTRKRLCIQKERAYS